MESQGVISSKHAPSGARTASFLQRSIVAAVAAVAGGYTACATAEPDAAAEIERGKYLAIAANCSSCHTARADGYMAGGVAFETPFGKIYSTNITPDERTGIGSWTSEQFLQSMRSGVRPNGEHLYPVFPYTSFTKMTGADIAALFAYLRSVPAISSTPPRNEMSFPFDKRALMSVWKTLFFEEGAWQPDPGQSAQWNRGAYLVESLAHCGACHTPRNFLGAEQADMAMTGATYMDRIPGGAVRPWSTANLTAASNGLGSWSVEDLAAYLKTGQNGYASTFGPMNEVIMNSTRHLSDADVLAMSLYLKSLPANEGDLGPAADEEVLSSGETLYNVHCGTCHLPTGKGSLDTGPALAGSPVVQAGDPAALINIMMYGPERPTPPLPTQWDAMEAYGDKLSDEEMAALASYLRSAWGNKGGAVEEDHVARQR